MCELYLKGGRGRHPIQPGGYLDVSTKSNTTQFPWKERERPRNTGQRAARAAHILEGDTENEGEKALHFYFFPWSCGLIFFFFDLFIIFQMASFTEERQR